MSKRKRVSRNTTIAAMIFFGVGLVLLGLSLWITWPQLESAQGNTGPTLSGGSITVPVAVHYTAPPLKLSSLDGTEHSLADYHGKVVLVNLWATWCPPCKAEMPTLDAFYQAHQSDGFITVAINDGDPNASVASFVKEYNLSFPVWLDPTYQATDHAFKTRNLPSSFVIDRDGNIRLQWVGEIDRAALEKYVTPLILE